MGIEQEDKEENNVTFPSRAAHDVHETYQMFQYMSNSSRFAAPTYCIPISLMFVYSLIVLSLLCRFKGQSRRASDTGHKYPLYCRRSNHEGETVFSLRLFFLRPDIVSLLCFYDI